MSCVSFLNWLDQFDMKTSQHFSEMCLTAVDSPVVVYLNMR